MERDVWPTHLRQGNTRSCGTCRPASPVADRFWIKVDKSQPDGCWIWRGAAQVDGRGNFYPGPGRSRCVPAYRIAWELTNGPIPEGLWVCHQCDNPPCVNPAHLFLGTVKENVADMVQKGRNARGEKSGSAKLTAALVMEIRRTRAAGFSWMEMARHFPTLSLRAIRDAAAGRTWRHVPGSYDHLTGGGDL